MKKTVFILAAILFAVGCASGINPLEEGAIVYVPQSERQEHELVFWHSMTAHNGVVLNELVQEFNETVGAELGITVNAVFQGSYADSSAQLRALLHTGNTAELPDISQIDATGMLDIKDSEYLARAGLFAALDPNFELGNINSAMLNNITYMGHLLGMPFSQSTRLLFYNRDMLREAGFYSPPSSLTEMAEILPLVSLPGQVYGFALSPATPDVQNWVGQQNGHSFMVDNQNGRGGDPTKVVFDGEGTMQAFLSQWLKLHETGGLRHIEGNTLEEFVAGRVAMMVASSSHIAAAENAIDGRFELGTAFFPRVHEGASYGSTIGGSSLFMFNKGELERMWAAWEVLKFLSSPSVQARWSMDTGYLAANYVSLQDKGFQFFLEENPNFAVAMRQLEASDPNLLGIWVPSSFQFFMGLRDGIISMIEDGRTAEETVGRLADSLNRILDDFHEMNR